MKIKITENQFESFLKNYNKKNENAITLLDLKNMINEDKKIHLNELEMVELGDTSYSNVGYDKDGTQNDKVYKGLLDDINTAAKNAGIKATITTAKTGHGVHTKGDKNVSRHMKQIAVDVAVLDGIGSNGASNEKNGDPKFRELGNKLKDELVKMGYVWNTESGKQKAVLWQTNIGGNHFNHLHISNKGNATEDELNAYANNVTPSKTSQVEKTPEKSSEDKREKTWAGKTIEKIKKLVAPRSILNSVKDGTVELKYGTKSDQVMQLQKDLKKVGLFDVEPTGYYGPLTVKAVKNLQTMSGIKVDGIFGDVSYGALYDKSTSEDVT